jgi:hypothetical protein
MAAAVPIREKYDFDPREFLATIGEGRRVVRSSKVSKIADICGIRVTICVITHGECKCPIALASRW